MEFVSFHTKDSEISLLESNVVLASDLPELLRVRAASMMLSYEENGERKNLRQTNDRFNLVAGVEAYFVIGVSSSVPSTPSPSFTTPIRRGNAAAAAAGMLPSPPPMSFGSRAVPSVLKKNLTLPGSSISSSSRGKRKASPETVYKTIILVNCFDGEQLNEGGEVPVDLLKLERQDLNFGIIQIQEEILFQLQMSMPSIKTTGFVLLNKKGNPLKNMPNTQGMFLFVTRPLSKGS